MINFITMATGLIVTSRLLNRYDVAMPNDDAMMC